MEKADENVFLSTLDDLVESRGIITQELVGENENPVFEKYDEFIPAALLRLAYAADKLRSDEAEEVALLHAQTDIFNAAVPAVVFGEVVGLNRIHHITS